ncbi:MAG TPA: hypothetical protein PLE19_05060 [Planctomycetota bacterium]|nr:hypothetical protein [Planctomycetota bacterium]HRR79856.1 hypothetical protein [Planctomycetota bacterium]HRT92932.1 hypothetical protein [Planctomycetota bacterium]
MFYKRTIPLAIVFVMGLLAFVHEFVPHPLSSQFREEMTTWFRIIGGFGMFIGVYSLLHMHTLRIRRKQAGWAYSVFVFLGAVTMIVVGLVNEPHGPLGPAPEDGTVFDWFYMNVQVPCGATIFSLLAFFMASAAFRTFRARNAEAALLLVAAVIVMFGRVPLSAMISDAFPQAADLLLEYPNLAAKRGILLGISLGAISQSLRILFGIERSYLGGGGD